MDCRGKGSGCPADSSSQLLDDAWKCICEQWVGRWQLVFSCLTVCSEGKPVVMIWKWQFVLWTGVCPSPITACGHAPVCRALRLFILSSDVPHCQVQLLKRLISHSGNLCSQSPCFQLRPCFVYPVNFYFCCAGCGMSSIDSGLRVCVSAEVLFCDTYRY